MKKFNFKLNFNIKSLINENLTKKHKLILAGVLGVFALAIAIVVITLNTHYAYKMPEDGFQVIAGEKYPLVKDTKFSFAKYGVKINKDYQQQFLVETPIYFDSTKETCVTPCDLIYVAGKRATYYKIPAFTSLTCKNNVLTVGKKSLTSGFLFDGKNSYTFLEEMTAVINGKEYKLGRFSMMYVSSEACYIYNTLTDEITTELFITDSVYAKNDNYMVDTLYDILFDQNGQKILIFNSIEHLENLDD